MSYMTSFVNSLPPFFGRSFEFAARSDHVRAWDDLAVTVASVTRSGRSVSPRFRRVPFDLLPRLGSSRLSSIILIPLWQKLRRVALLRQLLRVVLSF